MRGRTCEHVADDDAARECGRPATHTGIVPGGGGEVAVCDPHRQAAEADDALMYANPIRPPHATCPPGEDPLAWEMEHLPPVEESLAALNHAECGSGGAP